MCGSQFVIFLLVSIHVHVCTKNSLTKEINAEICVFKGEYTISHSHQGAYVQIFCSCEQNLLGLLLIIILLILICRLGATRIRALFYHRDHLEVRGGLRGQVAVPELHSVASFVLNTQAK
jgi:hypothetical protein